MIPGTYKRIRHVVSNMRFVDVDDNTAESVTVLTVFIDQASNPCCATVRLELLLIKRPPMGASPRNISLVTDVRRLDPSGSAAADYGPLGGPSLRRSGVA